MKVSAAWIGVLLIVSVVVYFTVYGYHVYEKFKNPEGVVSEEGFADPSSYTGINITTCPAGSKSLIDTGGRTICCMGDVTSDQCKGEAICSLSEKVGNLPTCSEWYLNYLRQRGRGRCPRSLPMYFESYDGKVKGCTFGRLNKEGTAPAAPDQKKCIIYQTKQQDEGKVDSCTNIKLLENTVCFPGSTVPAQKQLVDWYNGAFPVIVTCKFTDQNRTPSGCFTDDSIIRHVDSVIQYYKRETRNSYTDSIEKWKARVKNWDPISKVVFCSVAKKYKIDKTISFNDLPKLEVF